MCSALFDFGQVESDPYLRAGMCFDGEERREGRRRGEEGGREDGVCLLRRGGRTQVGFSVVDLCVCVSRYVQIRMWKVFPP